MTRAKGKAEWTGPGYAGAGLVLLLARNQTASSTVTSVSLNILSCKYLPGEAIAKTE